MAVGENLVPLVNIKIAGKWMFIPLKMVLIGIDPYPYGDFLNLCLDGAKCIQLTIVDNEIITFINFSFAIVVGHHFLDAANGGFSSSGEPQGIIRAVILNGLSPMVHRPKNPATLAIWLVVWNHGISHG